MIQQNNSFEKFPDLFPTCVWGHLHGLHFSLGCICLLRCRVLHRLHWGYQLLCCLPWAARRQPASPIVFSMGCRGMSALAREAPPFPLTLVPVGLFLLHCFTLLSHNCCIEILVFLKYAIPEVPSTLLMDSFGQQWAHFGDAWNWLCLT